MSPATRAVVEALHGGASSASIAADRSESDATWSGVPPCVLGASALAGGAEFRDQSGASHLRPQSVTPSNDQRRAVYLGRRRRCCLCCHRHRRVRAREAPARLPRDPLRPRPSEAWRPPCLSPRPRRPHRAAAAHARRRPHSRSEDQSGAAARRRWLVPSRRRHRTCRR